MPGQMSTATMIKTKIKTKAAGTINTGDNSSAKTPISTVVSLESRRIFSRQQSYEASNA
jgi:hypothetical protein